MACTITIGSVVGILPSSATAPTSIEVSGTATGCTTGELKVTIDCGGTPTSILVPIDSAGNWFATFDSNVDCACDKPISVTATCTDGQCEAKTSVPLRCKPPAPCPTIGDVTVVVDGCAGSGTVPATATAVFTVTLVPATSGCTYTWNFGDGSPTVTTTVPTVTHVYSTAGTFTASVIVTCPSQTGSPCVDKDAVRVIIPSCGQCPTVVGLHADPVMACAGPGTATVNFSGTLVPALPGCSFLWSFGDGSPPVITAVPSATHVYNAPMMYAVAVTAICPNITPCATATLVIDVPRCCPVVTNIQANIEDNECAGNGNKATFIFNAVTNPAAASGNYTWDFGDGSPSVTNPGANATHDYAAAGTYTVTVTYVPDPSTHPNCSPSSVSISTVDVPACPGKDDDDDDNGGGGGGGWGCFGLRVIMTIAAILGLVALALAACIPPAAYVLAWIAAGLGLLALIAGILWGIFCPKPCLWGLLLAWQVSIGAGLLLLCFTTCCPIFWPIGLGLVAAGIALMLIWKRRCRKNQCQVLKELVIAISGVLIPLLGSLGLIPVLAPCLNPLVTAAVSVLAGVITIMAASCIP